MGRKLNEHVVSTETQRESKVGAGLRSEQQDFTTSLGTKGRNVKTAGKLGYGVPPTAEGLSAPPCQG